MAHRMEKIEEKFKTSIIGELINTVIFTLFMYFSGLFDLHRGNIMYLSFISGFLYLFIYGFRKYILIEIEIFKSKIGR